MGIGRGWSWIAATAALLVGGLAYAAGAGKRMPPPAYVAELLTDLESAAERLEPHSPARKALEAGDLEAAREMLAFRPYDEAPLPEGFPAFTPVGVIEVKRYPAYRKAVGPAFWTLFQHIQKQGIPMTAPVEMADVGSVSGRGEMAFLYQNTGVGEPGPIDGVAVEDTPAATVLSIGMRGDTNREAAAEARELLERWLEESAEYRVADVESPFRLMGYNSPMVRGKQRYWEAQLLVEKAPVEEAE